MAFEHPILTKRIPTPPFGEFKDRHYVGYDEYVKTGGYEALKKAMDLGHEAVLKEVRDAEVRGRGGGGFPAGLKWSFLPPEDGGQRFLAINADESEPGTFKDRVLIDFDPHLIIEGITICMLACRLDTAYFFIRGEYHKQRETFERAIAEAYEHNILGPDSIMGQLNGRSPNLYLHRSAGAYICGEETALLEGLEGKRGWPRVKPPFPAVAGAFNRPTVINNVETLSLVPWVVDRGANWYKSMGTLRPDDAPASVPASFGPKLYGVSGHVNRPGVYEDELGKTVREMVEDYCQGMRNGKKFKAAIPGGISMGILTADEFEAKLDFDIGKKHNVLGLGTAGVVVMDEDVDMVAVARNCARFFSNESCGQCTPCREGGKWMYKILTRIEQGQGTTRDLEMLLEISGSMGMMPGTTICGLADAANWSVRTIVNKFWDEFEARVSQSSSVSLAVLSA